MEEVNIALFLWGLSTSYLAFHYWRKATTHKELFDAAMTGWNETLTDWEKFEQKTTENIQKLSDT